jgi:hypothetical protein
VSTVMYSVLYKRKGISWPAVSFIRTNQLHATRYLATCFCSSGLTCGTSWVQRRDMSWSQCWSSSKLQSSLRSSETRIKYMSEPITAVLYCIRKPNGPPGCKKTWHRTPVVCQCTQRVHLLILIKFLSNNVAILTQSFVVSLSPFRQTPGW